MSSRRNKVPEYDEHFRQPSGLVHPDAIHSREQHSPSVHLENRFMSQEAKIEELAKDNHQLASSHLVLRQDLVAVQQESKKLRDHIRSIQTEADIQVRIWLDKIAKAEANIGAREKIKMELQEAHIEAQSLETTRQELTAKIEQATKQLDNAREDLKRLPEMPFELDNLRQEHESLRKSFEYERGLNTEKVEQMKALERDVISKTEEVEKLRAELSNAEKRASAPTMCPGPTPFPGHVSYIDNFSRSHLPTVGGGSDVEGANPYPSGGFSADPPANNPAIAAAGDHPWGGTCELSHPQ